MASAANPRIPGGETVSGNNQDRAPIEDDFYDDDSLESLTSDSCSDDEDNLHSQNDHLSAALNVIVPPALQHQGPHGSLSQETDNYVVTEYRTLCDAINKWVDDAFLTIGFTGGDLSAKLSALMNLAKYERKYDNERIRPLCMRLLQRVGKTNVLPKAYVAHWIMFKLVQDIFDEEYPLGLERWESTLDPLAQRVEVATGTSYPLP